MEPTISVTIAVAVLVAFVVYSGFTLATLGNPVRRAGAGFGAAFAGAGFAGAGLPIGGPTGAAGQLASTCLVSLAVTAPATASDAAPVPDAPAPTITAERPALAVRTTATGPTPGRAEDTPVASAAGVAAVAAVADPAPARTAPARIGPVDELVGDLVTDPVGEPPPLLWLREADRTKDLTQSAKPIEASELD